MGILRRKEEKKGSEEKLNREISEFLSSFSAREIELFLIMNKASEQSSNGPYDKAMLLYSEKVRDKLMEIEDEILSSSQKLMVRHLLDDIEENEYIKGMEEMKIKLSILRGLQEYTDFIIKNKIRPKENLDVVSIGYSN